MNKELFLSQALIKFENLGELVETLDEYIELHTAAIAKYGDKLGGLLRAPGSNTKSHYESEYQKDEQSSQSFEQSPVNGRKDGKRRENMDSEGWLVLEADDYALKLASGNASSLSAKQSASMFKIVESLKERVALLQAAQKVINTLPAEGFKQDQAFVAVFRDGVPRQIIPTFEESTQKRKFRYSENFEIRVLA